LKRIGCGQTAFSTDAMIFARLRRMVALSVTSISW
jgi:hypothetical protein